MIQLYVIAKSVILTKRRILIKHGRSYETKTDLNATQYAYKNFERFCWKQANFKLKNAWNVVKKQFETDQIVLHVFN